MTFTKPNVDQCTKVFKQIDVDQSGKLDLNEIASAFKLLGVNLGKDEIDGVMKIVDQNNDGQMDVHEFTHMVYVCQNNKANDLPTLLFLATDRDFSGMVDAQELHSIFNKLEADLTLEEAQDLAKEVSGREDGQINYTQFKDLLKQVME